MKENRDYSGKTERIIEEEYDKHIKEIDSKLNIDRRIKQTNSARRKQVAIQKSVMIAAFAVLTTLGAKQAYNINKGEEMIANDFHSNVTSDIGCGNYTDGFHFNIGQQNVSYDYAIDYIRSQADSKGYDDVQTYIALKKMYSKEVAKDVVGKTIDGDDIIKEAYKTYKSDTVEKEEGASYGK